MDGIICFNSGNFLRYGDDPGQGEQLVDCPAGLIAFDAEQDYYDRYTGSDFLKVLASFMASGNTEPVFDTPFRKPNTYGLFEKGVIDSKGDVTLLEMYKDYDEETEEFSNLAVKETRTYYRNSVGIVTKRLIVIKWYRENGCIASRDKEFTKFFNAVEGLIQNQKSRTNLTNQAGLWVTGDLIAEYGAEAGETKAQEFLESITEQAVIYKNAIDIAPLVAAVNNTTYDYMTEDSQQYPGVSRKDVFNGIINISYP